MLNLYIDLRVHISSGEDGRWKRLLRTEIALVPRFVACRSKRVVYWSALFLVLEVAALFFASSGASERDFALN